MPPKAPVPTFVDTMSSDDSDDDTVDNNAPSVTLGFSDGPIVHNPDRQAPKVSKMGGYPSFLFSPPELPTCLICKQLLSLLLQIYAPLDNTQVDGRDDYDRILYVWYCPRKGCKGKDETIQVTRALKRCNPIRTQDFKSEKAQNDANNSKNTPFFNPFASSTNSTYSLNSVVNPFAKDCQTESQPTTGPSHNATSDPVSPQSPPIPAPEIEQLHLKPFTGTSRHESVNENVFPEPQYPSVYLATDYEPLLSRRQYTTHGLSASAKEAIREFEGETNTINIPKSNITNNKRSSKNSKPKLNVDDDAIGHGKSGGDERYEVQKMDHIDSVFLEFMNRVQSGGPTQCVRYKRGGTPLPYTSKDPTTYPILWPLARPGVPIAVTRSAHVHPGQSVTGSHQRVYDPCNIQQCQYCGSKRIFELQLMAHISTELRKARGECIVKPKNGDEPNKEKDNGEKSPGKIPLEDDDEMFSWATAFVFVCEKDCVDSTIDNTWRKEIILLQKEP